MYQEDMINEGDGCGGMTPGMKKMRVLPTTKPPVEKEMKMKLSWKCGECGHESALECKFCSMCGHKRPDPTEGWWCTKCHIQHHAHHKFCSCCGVPHMTPTARRTPNEEKKEERTEQVTPDPATFLDRKIIPVQRVVPWKKNGTRTIATAGSPAYYGIYVHEIIADWKAIRIKLLALGEWNLASPKTTLFCVREDWETWDTLAQAERRMQKQSANYSSRFDRGTWQGQCDSRGYYEGYLVLPRSFLPMGRNVVLSMRYASSTPWNAEYAVVDLLQQTKNNIIQPCPFQKLPVPPEDPWKPIFPREVEQRFREREWERDPPSS